MHKCKNITSIYEILHVLAIILCLALTAEFSLWMKNSTTQANL